MVPIDIHQVEKVAERLPVIEEVSYRFLNGWRNRFLDLRRRQPTDLAGQASPPEWQPEQRAYSRFREQLYFPKLVLRSP